MQTNNFIDNIISCDLKNKKHDTIFTRFPPEPNGFLHLGHIKSIVLNFSLADKYQGLCNLRFDDTNPQKEEQKYIDGILRDLKYLGFKPNKICHSSDYFDKLYDSAHILIAKNLAFVDEQTPEQIKENRGTLTKPGVDSPYRNRPIKENKELFNKMKNGDFANGKMVLRAKIDMASPNLNLRDPVIYRILNVAHQRTGDKWHIYPMYDYTHCVSDAIESITHSLCTLEFEDHRPLYNWFLKKLEFENKPRQIEFAALNLERTILSKRKLKQLVDEKIVSGWDDPRMPTIAALEKKGVPPHALINFCQMIGVTKKDSVIEYSALDGCIRDELNKKSPRAMAVINPIKLTISNYLGNDIEIIRAKNYPQNETTTLRDIPFGRELYIEACDVMENAPAKYRRFTIGREVRLKYAYYATCTDIIKNDEGTITEIICTYDKKSKGGKTDDKRKVKGTIHWVSAKKSIDATLYLYEHLFNVVNPSISLQNNIKDYINPKSLQTIKNCKLEPNLSNPENIVYQFERLGYFYADQSTKTPSFHRTTTLRKSSD